MSIYLRKATSMCYEREYISFEYHHELYGTAPFIVVGRVLLNKHNTSHQVIRFKITCVYKAPPDVMESLLDQEVRFTAKLQSPCRPLLKTDSSYFFFFEEMVTIKKRKRKKKKNSGSDFTRMSLGHPIPVEEMDLNKMENLAEKVKKHKPIGHCYNIWSKWSRCSEQCGMGTMERVYPRLNKASLTQRAVCQHASCKSHSTDKEQAVTPFQADQYREDLVQNQPMSIGTCTSMDFLRVTHCEASCKNPSFTRTAVTWEMHLTLMACKDLDNENNERVEYHNVAVPSKCGCVDPHSPQQKYSEIKTASTHLVPRSSWRRRHLNSTGPSSIRGLV